MKNLSKPTKILLIIFMGVIFLMLSFKVGYFVFCHTVAYCDPVSPASPKMIATSTAAQYELAIQEIKSGQHYDRAKQRLEYVIRQDPDYPDAAEKLLEVEKILNATGTP